MTASIVGIAAAVPRTRQTSAELDQLLEMESGWIEQRTGIRERRVADGIATSDLAVAAGTSALESAGVRSVGCVIVATTTPDLECPGTAPTVASRMGLVDTAAFDLQATCSGFLYGLWVATSLAHQGGGDVLLIGADTFTRTCDPKDASTRPLIGDGAGAVIVRSSDSDSEPGSMRDFCLSSDGAGVPHIHVARRGDSPGYFHMNGREVFKEAVSKMTASVRSVAGGRGWPLDSLDWIVPHQANARIMRAVAGELQLPADRVVNNIGMFGNTVAATIPMALHSRLQDGQVRAGQRLALTSFGGGFTWGGCSLLAPEVSVPELVEL